MPEIYVEETDWDDEGKNEPQHACLSVFNLVYPTALNPNQRIYSPDTLISCKWIDNCKEADWKISEKQFLAIYSFVSIRLLLAHNMKNNPGAWPTPNMMLGDAISSLLHNRIGYFRRYMAKTKWGF